MFCRMKGNFGCVQNMWTSAVIVRKGDKLFTSMIALPQSALKRIKSAIYLQKESKFRVTVTVPLFPDNVF